jgi:hypothetical protein
VRSPAAWQAWFKRRRRKFLGDVRATRANQGLYASANLDNGETSKAQSQSDLTDERVDNDPRDGDEDANAIAEYLLTTPRKSDETLMAYWEGFRTLVGFTRPITLPDLF